MMLLKTPPNRNSQKFYLSEQKDAGIIFLKAGVCQSEKRRIAGQKKGGLGGRLR